MNFEALTITELFALRIAVNSLSEQGITEYYRTVSWEKILTKIDRAIEVRTNNLKL
jgi:hypothetical protein